LRRTQIELGAFASIVVLKVLLAAIYGPIFTRDSNGYAYFAKEILRSTAWLHDAQLSSGPFPILAIRMVGYPAILAAAMRIAGGSWPYLIIALQIAVAMGALWAIYRLGIELRLPWWISLAGIIAFATSDKLVLDQCILTDSLYADFVIFAGVIIASGACSDRPLSLLSAALAGALLAIAFLFREATPFLTVTLIPLLALSWWNGRSVGAIRPTLACVLIVLPMLGTTEAYRNWNEHRSGERFVTTSSQITLVSTLIKAAGHDQTVFDGGTPLDLAARRDGRTGDFRDVDPINQDLFEQGYRSTAIARMAEAHYLATWGQRPLAMLHVLRDHISENAAKLAFRPIAATCMMIEWATNERECLDYRDLLRAARSGFSDEPLSHVLIFILQTCEQTVSIFLFSAFLIGSPTIFAMSWLRDRSLKVGRELLVLSFWAMYVGWFLIYGVVYMDNRYMVPVVPFSILGALVVVQQIVRRPPRFKADRGVDGRDV